VARVQRTIGTPGGLQHDRGGKECYGHRRLQSSFRLCNHFKAALQGVMVRRTSDYNREGTFLRRKRPARRGPSNCCFPRNGARWNVAAPLRKPLRLRLNEKDYGDVQLQGGLGQVGRKPYGYGTMVMMTASSKLYGDLSRFYLKSFLFFKF